jgi:DASS family divalent anion:Na+ symporter
VFFNAGYVGQAAWWKLGFILSLVNVAIWFGLGSLWWRLLGLW